MRSRIPRPQGSGWPVAALVCLALLALAGCADGGSEDGGRGDGGVSDGGDGAVTDGAMDGNTPPSTCAMEGDPCDADGDGCTEDICRGGLCVGGAPRDCDDGIDCTEDVCVSGGPTRFECEHPIANGACVAEGTCRSAGDRDPANDCRICDPSRSQTLWSSAEGSCDDGDACTDSDRCSSAGCVGDPRVDSYESNDTRAAASGLGNVSDGDSFPFATIQGTLFPDGDMDWFVYNDSDDFLGSIFPRAQLQNVPGGSDYDLCLYIACESSFDSLTCTAGTQATAGGLSGCCSRNGAGVDENVRIDHNCTGTDDSADVYVQVTRVSGPAVCDTPYTLRYGDD